MTARHPIERLHAAILDVKAGGQPGSRTAKLLREGIGKMAKKLAEEAVEVSLDAVQGERQRVVEESADLVYNLAILWVEMGVAPADIWAEMEWRERSFGMAEKVPKEAARSGPG